MSKTLLVRYIREIIESSPIARVPNQLIDPDETDGKEESEERGIEEFSSAGAVAGYTAPLGLGSTAMAGYRRKKKK